MGKIPYSSRFSGALEAIWPEAESSYPRTSRSGFTCRATCYSLAYLQEFCGVLRGLEIRDGHLVSRGPHEGAIHGERCNCFRKSFK